MVRDNFVGSVSYCREYEEGAVVLSGALASPVREPYTRSRPADYKLARHPRSCLTSHACVGKLWMVRIPGVRDAWEGGDYVGVKVKHVLTRDDPPFSVQADGRLFTRYPRVSEVRVKHTPGISTTYVVRGLSVYTSCLKVKRQKSK